MILCIDKLSTILCIDKLSMILCIDKLSMILSINKLSMILCIDKLSMILCIDKLSMILCIDKLSMILCIALFTNVDLHQPRMSNLWFGGFSVILLGDLGQFPRARRRLHFPPHIWVLDLRKAIQLIVITLNRSRVSSLMLPYQFFLTLSDSFQQSGWSTTKTAKFCIRR